MTRLSLACCLTLASLLLAPTADSQEDPRASLFGGYSYLRAEMRGADDGDVHGFQFDYTYFGTSRIGFKVTGTAHWGEVDAAPNIFGAAAYDSRTLSAMAGPHLVVVRGLTTEVGLSLLGGAVWRRFETAVSSLSVSDDSSIAAAVQLSIDFRLSERVWLRAAQPAIVWTRFDDDTQINYRFSIGVVLKAGEILR